MKDVVQLKQVIERIHHEHVIIEAHRDCYEQIYLRNHGHQRPLHDSMIPRLEKGGIDLVFYAIGGDTLAHSDGTNTPLRATLQNLDYYYQEAVEGSKIQTVLTSTDLPLQGPNGKIHYLLHLEGGLPLEGKISSLRMLYRLGVRSIQLTWNGRNELGEGVKERNHGGGLSTFGVEVVKEAQNLGMLIDVSHLSGPGVDDILDLAELPIIASHCNAAKVHDHPRNLSDDRIIGIARTGGVVGLHFKPAYIHATQNTIERLIDHLDYMVELVGIDHLGIGPDFTKSDGPRSPRENGYNDKQKRVLEVTEIDELPLFTEALLRRGYTEEDISKIYGGNFLRVLKQVLDKSGI